MVLQLPQATTLGPATSVEGPIFAKEKEKEKEQKMDNIMKKTSNNSTDPSPRNSQKTPTVADFAVTGKSARNEPKPDTASEGAPKWVNGNSLNFNSVISPANNVLLTNE